MTQDPNDFDAILDAATRPQGGGVSMLEDPGFKRREVSGSQPGDAATPPEETKRREDAASKELQSRADALDAVLQEATTPQLSGRALVKQTIRRAIMDPLEMTGDILVGVDRALQPTDQAAGGGYLGTDLPTSGVGELDRAESIRAPLRQAGEALSPDAPSFDFRPTLLEDVVGGGASMVPFVLIGAATSPLGPAAAATAIGATGASQGFGEKYFEALANRGSDQDALKAGLIGAAGGATESFGAEFGFIARILGKAGTGSLVRRLVTQTVTAAPREAVQESVQELIGNVATRLTDDERGLLDNVARSGLIGGILGVVVSGAAEVVNSVRKSPEEPGSGRITPTDVPRGTLSESGPDAGQRPAEMAPLTFEQSAALHTPEEQKLGLPRETVDADLTEIQSASKPSAAITPGQAARAAFARARGTEVTYVDDAEFDGYYKGGRAYINSRLTEDEQAGQIVYHELVHALRDQKPTEFERLYASIAAVDPEGLLQAQARYKAAFKGELPADIETEEGLARRVQELAGWVDIAHRDVGRLQRIAARNPGLMTRLIDAIKRLLRSFGAEVRTSMEKELDALGPLVAQAGTRPEIAAQIAMRIKESLDGMVGELARATGPGRFETAYIDDADVKITGKFAPKQTETDAFKAWFGDYSDPYAWSSRMDPNKIAVSKVVGKDGKPQVLYHGTLGTFSKFEAGRPAKNSTVFGSYDTERSAIFLAEDPEHASAFTSQGGETSGGNIMPVYADAKAPLDLRNGFTDDMLDDFEKEGINPRWLRNVSTHWELFDGTDGRAFVEAAKRIGYDSVLFSDTDPDTRDDRITWAVFSPEQIKSATGNVGTFDAKNPDIRFAPTEDQPVAQPVTAPASQRVQDILAATNKAGDEGELTEVGSSPSKIAGISEDPRTRAFQRGVREVRGPDEVVVSRAEQQAKADALDRDAVLIKAETGAPLDAAETLALRDLNAAVTQSAMRKGATQADIERAAAVSWTYQDVRRETARALGVSQDPLNQTGAEQLSDIIMEPSPDARVKLERIKKEMKDATPERKKYLKNRRKKILEDEAAKVERIKKKLWDSGFPPELISRDHFTDPYLKSQIHRIISTEKTGFWDAVMEYRIASMLSGPLTHARNIAGNAAYATYDQHLVRLSEAMVNTVFRDKNSASFKELVPFYRAQLPAIAQAGRNALLAFKTERPVWEADLKSKGVDFEEGSKIDALGGAAIPGTAGRVVRTPLRALQAEDEVAKSIVGLTETVALSYRAAVAEGLTGDALVNRAHEIASDYTHPVHRQAIRSAQRVAFQGPAGPITQRVMEIRSALNTMPGGVPVGSLLLPFVKTPAAIFRIGLGLPFHPLSMLYRAASGQYRGNPTRLVRDTAELVWALPIAAYLVYLVSIDDEEPIVTGTTDRATSGLDRRTFPPYTVKIGGERYSYRSLEPLSTSIATTIDMAEAARDSGDAGAAFGALVKSLVDQTKDKTFLRTLGDILEAAEHPDGSTLPTLVRETLITPFIPNIIRQPMAQKDKEVHTAAVRKSGDDGVWTSAAKSIPYRIRPDMAPVVYDLWGRTVEREGSRNPIIVRLLSPVGEATQDVHALDRLILRYNRTGGDPFYPRAPNSYATVDGETVFLTGEQYARLTREAGQLSVEKLKGARLNYENPTEDDIEKIKKAIRDARAEVRKNILETIEARK